MKTKVIISLMGLLFISSSFIDGCEEEEPKPDYINVYLGAEGSLRTRDLNGGGWICDHVTKNEPVKIDFYKSDALKYTFTLNTDNYCKTEFTGHQHFKLYREQLIEVKAYSENVPVGYTQVRGYVLVDWDDVYPEFDFGDTYTTNVVFEVEWLFN
jgi:hypothetical protein